MSTVNTGYQGFKILEEYYTDDGSVASLIKPNIKNIDPLAIVSNTATITYNDFADVTPTGGVNGDIWYNHASDTLYKNLSGTWTLLVNKVINTDYVAPIQNLTACPI